MYKHSETPMRGLDTQLYGRSVDRHISLSLPLALYAFRLITPRVQIGSLISCSTACQSLETGFECRQMVSIVSLVSAGTLATAQICVARQ